MNIIELLDLKNDTYNYRATTIQTKIDKLEDLISKDFNDIEYSLQSLEILIQDTNDKITMENNLLKDLSMYKAKIDQLET